MTEFASLVMRLMAALGTVESGDELGVVRALRGLVALQDERFGEGM